MIGRPAGPTVAPIGRPAAPASVAGAGVVVVVVVVVDDPVDPVELEPLEPPLELDPVELEPVDEPELPVGVLEGGAGAAEAVAAASASEIASNCTPGRWARPSSCTIWEAVSASAGTALPST